MNAGVYKIKNTKLRLIIASVFTIIFLYEMKMPLNAYAAENYNGVEICITVNNETFTSFNDVPKDAWYAGFINEAAAKGIVQGIGRGLYEPERFITRAEFIQITVNALNLPETESDIRIYYDVTEQNWYYNAIVRAKSAGFINIFQHDFIDPNKNITKEEIAAIIGAVIRYKNISVPILNEDISDFFVDFADIDESYLTDIELVCKLKIMVFDADGGKFDPKGSVKRSQAALIQLTLLETLEHFKENELLT